MQRADFIGHGSRSWIVNNGSWRVAVDDDVAAFMLEDGRSGAVLAPDSRARRSAVPVLRLRIHLETKGIERRLSYGPGIPARECRVLLKPNPGDGGLSPTGEIGLPGSGGLGPNTVCIVNMDGDVTQPTGVTIQYLYANCGFPLPFGRYVVDWAR